MPSKLGVYAVFDWPGWAWGNEFLRRGEPDAVAAVSGPDCVRLLTVLIRKERFAEGTWIWSAETGMLQALLHRILDVYRGR